MSRWIERLSEIRNGTRAQATRTPSACSKCSIVQNGPPRDTFGHLNNLNSAERTSNFDATDLCCLYHEQAAIYEFDGGLVRPGAEAMAWEHVAMLWHRQHYLRVNGDLCAGCGQPLGGATEVALFPRGARAHADNGFDCIYRYFALWRREAATALLAMGIPTPPETAAEITQASK